MEVISQNSLKRIQIILNFINRMSQEVSNTDFLMVRPSSITRKTHNQTSSIGEQQIKKVKDEGELYDLQMLDATQTGKLLNVKSQAYNKHQVPIVKITKKTSKVNLVPKSKGQQQAFPQIIARGRLLDTSNVQSDLNGRIDFQGNFKGVFDKDEVIGRNQMLYYFEGEITHLKIITIDGVKPTNQQIQKFKNLTRIRGYFKGIFIPQSIMDEPHSIQQFCNSDQWNLHQKIIKQQANKVEYHVPALVGMDIRKIQQINLKKSSAQIAAIFKIDIQLNQQVLNLFYSQQQQKFTHKYKLTIDFHRGKPFVLPFYNPDDFQQTDEQVQYEWDDVWQGIDLQVQWSKQLMRMSYRIRTIYTAQIDNSHGIFYAPFNLNILKIVVDFHSIKINSKTKICINCCDFTDFNTGKYSPYTYFHHLQRDLSDQNNHEQIYQKHIDRLTKLDTTHFVDQGQFKIANNRLCLFPYHKRVFKNKNQITSDLSWTVGLTDKNSLLQTPEVTGIRENYNLNEQNKLSIFELQQWEFVHIEIPIFKYPVIDIIRIFVPIIILSAISMTIFWQQNANDYNGFTELAKRMASGCSLMVGYVALIPMIRSNLPPTPSVTLIQILIYLSVIPNFLAICSVFVTSGMDTDQFFATYQAFVDPLFLISFIICCVSLVILSIMMIVYAGMDYKSDFTIYKFKPSPLSHLRAPAFLSYIQKLKRYRGEYEIKELPIPYDNFGQPDDEECFD